MFDDQPHTEEKNPDADDNFGPPVPDGAIGGVESLIVLVVVAVLLWLFVVPAL